MAQFGYLQAGSPGFYRLFRREIFICRNLILERMLFDALSVDFGGPRPGGIPSDVIFHRLFFTHAFPIPVFSPLPPSESACSHFLNTRGPPEQCHLRRKTKAEYEKKP